MQVRFGAKFVVTGATSEQATAIQEKVLKTTNKPVISGDEEGYKVTFFSRKPDTQDEIKLFGKIRRLLSHKGWQNVQVKYDSSQTFKPNGNL